MTSSHSFRLRILRSGSSGNAIFLEAAGTRLIIDVGLPAEVVARELDSIPGASPITAILLTHEHDDHAKGAGALSRLLGAPVLANAGTLAAAGDLLTGASTASFVTGVPFRVGGAQVEAFPVPHDAAEPVGFVVSANGGRTVIATDLGGVTDDILTRASDAAARAVVEVASDRPQTVFLVHLSDINNLTPLARDTVQWALEREGIAAVRVEAVRPNGTSPLWEMQ